MLEKLGYKKTVMGNLTLFEKSNETGRERTSIRINTVSKNVIKLYRHDPFDWGHNTPVELTLDEIKAILEIFENL